MKLKHFKGFFNQHDVEVIEVKNVFEDYYTVKFDPKGVNWTVGEHAIFSMPDKSIEGKKWRAFSIASSPDEGYMMIGTRTGSKPSSFKENLLGLKEGDKVHIKGPFGWFLVENNGPLVFFASGVGITPTRAILSKYKTTDRKITLVYSGEYHLFKEDLDEFNDAENINVIYTNGKDSSQNELQTLVNKYGNDATYYISGAQTVIKSTKSYLKSLGVKSKKMINDPFLGY